MFEITFDKTTPTVDGVEYKSNYMVECELKNGNSAYLYFINQFIKSFDFIEECKLSETLALYTV